MSKILSEAISNNKIVCISVSSSESVEYIVSTLTKLGFKKDYHNRHYVDVMWIYVYAGTRVFSLYSTDVYRIGDYALSDKALYAEMKLKQHYNRREQTKSLAISAAFNKEYIGDPNLLLQDKIVIHSKDKEVYTVMYHSLITGNVLLLEKNGRYNEKEFKPIDEVIHYER